MKHTDWCRDWEFQYGEPSNFPGMKPKTVTVTLPHDAMIAEEVKEEAKGGAETGFYQGVKASYTKYLDQVSPGKKYILSFDGCAGAMKLIINGNLALRHHYAYTPFQADITHFLSMDRPNRITVTVNNTDEPNSRWYSGAGLYRRVELLTSGNVYIVPNGIAIRTEKIENGTASIEVEIPIANEGEQGETASVGVKIRRHGEAGEGKWVETGTVSHEILPAGSRTVVQKAFEIKSAALWDVDTPNLYDLEVILKSDQGAGNERDSSENALEGRKDAADAVFLDAESVTFGIRTITMDAENGLRLNGRGLKLKGGCIHHDNGILGAAAFRDAEYRKVRMLKENGFNAIRGAHNPMSTDFLNACDELGMLVIDEAFDVWNMEKDDFDFSQYFDREWETELSNMILRDRNHPCVFLWSIGNEIPEQGGLSGGHEISRKLAAKVRELDSTRAVGGALCSFFRGLSDEDNEKYWASVMAHAEELKKNGMVNLDSEFGRSVFDSYTASFVEDWDAVGYNYLRYQYEPTHENHPDRVIICTESKPRELFDYWEDVKRLPYLIGDFEWTAVDYLGEAGIGDSYYVDPEDAAKTQMMMFRAQFPSRTAGAGDFDICGFEKPQLYYRRIVWGSKETAVVTHDPAHNGKVELLGRYGWGDVQHGYSWDAEPGAEIRAEVYSAAPEVELLLNGKSLGRKPAGIGQQYKASFVFAYEPGTLTAVSYDAGGEEISRDEVRSAGEPDHIRLTVQSDLQNDSGSELFYVTAEIVDRDGQRVPWAEDLLKMESKGDAKLLAFGSGRSATTENYTTGQFTTYEGRVLGILRRTENAGSAIVTVSGSRYGEKKLKIRW